MKKKPTTAKHSEGDSVTIPKMRADFFANAVRVSTPEELWEATGSGVPKQQITLRVDSDVIDFFRRQGKGYQRLMNFALRAYMLRRKSAESSAKSVAGRKKRSA